MKPRFIRTLFSLAAALLSATALAQTTSTVSVNVTGNTMSGSGQATINLAALGTENTVSFTLTWDPAVLSYVSNAIGSAVPTDGSATITRNTTQTASGRMTVLIGLEPGTTYTAGTKHLLTVNFNVLAAAATTNIAFTDSPTARRVVDANAAVLSSTFTDATISTTLPPAAPAITTQPQSQTVNVGANVTFSVVATGSPAPSYQWKKDGTDISGATNSSLQLTSVTGANVGSYTVFVSNSSGNLTSNAATLALNPGFGSFSPASGTQGTSVVITGAGFTGATGVSFNGIAASYTVDSNHQITAVVPTFATTGVITVTPATGSALTSSSSFTVGPGPRLAGMAQRAVSMSGESALSANFTIEGSTAKTVLVRVMGPTLQTFGATGFMLDPFLALYTNAGVLLTSNNDWGENTNASVITTESNNLLLSALPTGSKDAALLVELQPGTYTARVTGFQGSAGGEALIEVYEIDSTSRLAHVANRAEVSGAGTHTSFRLTGTSGKQTVLVRAVGAGLGLTGALANPTITVKMMGATSETTVATNDNHGSTNVSQSQLAAATAAAGAMPLATNDSALLLNLDPGTYSVETSGVGATSGIVMTEVFVVDAARASMFPPAILAPLHDKAVPLGGAITLAAPFVGKPAPTFQWQKDGADISGQTNATLTLSGFNSAASGSYRVVLSPAGHPAVTSGAATLSVARATQVITFPEIAAKTFGVDTSFTLNATTSATGLTVSYFSANADIATVSDNVVTIIKAGTVIISAIQAGSPDYEPAEAVNRTLTINKGAATIALGNLSATYDGTAKAVTATTTPASLPVTITYLPAGSAGTPSTTAPVNAGSYTVTATVDHENYQGTQTDTLVIAKAAQAITFGELASATFGDAAFTVSATGGASGQPVTFSSSDPTVATVSETTVTIAGAGTANIIANQAGNENYDAAPAVSRALVVAKANQMLTFGALGNKTYGDAAFTVSAAASSTLAPVFTVVSGPATVSGNTVTITGAGTVTIRASQPGNNNFNPATSVDQSFTVAKGNQTITFTLPASVALDQSPVTLSATATSGLAVSFASSDPTVATVSGNSLTLLKTGTTQIMAMQDGDTNFNPAASVTVTLQVLAASQTITFAQTELPAKTFAPNATFTIKATSNRGLLITFTSNNSNVATVSTGTLSGNDTTATVTIVGAGTANITASQAGNADYAAAPDVTRTLTVNKADQTITFATLANKTYLDVPFDVTATASSGLTVGFSIVSGPATISGNQVTITGAGSVTVRAAQAGDANYNAAPNVDRTFTVAKAPQTITFALASPLLINVGGVTLGGSASSVLPVTYTSSNPAVAMIDGTSVVFRSVGSAIITARQAGNENYLAAPDVTQTLRIDPVAPVIVSTPPTTITAVVGSSFVFGPITLNALSAPVTFTATGLPAGLTVDARSGNISGVPAASATLGAHTITLTASNVTGTDSTTINLTLQPPAPVITSPAAASGEVNTAFTYNTVATNSPASYSISGTLPAGLSFSTSTGKISGTPTQAAVGTHTVNITATNATGSNTLPLVITISLPANAPAYAGATNPSATAGAAFNFVPDFGSGTGTTTFALTGTLPSGLSFNSSTGEISGTTNQVGSFPVTISATRSGVAVPVELTLTVNPAATAPTVTSASTLSATVGTAFTHTLASSPVATSYSVTDMPGATFTLAASGLTHSGTTISGTPTALGTLHLLVRGTNTAGTGPQSVLVITISPHGNAPVISSAPAIQGTVGVAFSGVSLAATNTPTQFMVTAGSLPDGLSLNLVTGEIAGTPSAAGRTEVGFAASNANGRGHALLVTFNIASAPTTPVITSNGTATGQVGQSFRYVITGTNTPTSFAATNLPAWASLDVSSGVISGIPTSATTQPISVALTATNASGVSSPKTLLLTVVPAPATPEITSALSMNGRVGLAFTYTITASENATSFVASGLPPGLSLASSTGVISGTPTQSDSYAVTLRAANAAGLGPVATLTLSIAPAPAAPAITSAASASGKVGQSFSYSTAATGSPTSYALTGMLPLGLAFNSSTGAITGNPAESGVFTVALTATGLGGTSVPQSLALNIAAADAAPIITSPTVATATVGVDFSYQITASATPAFPAAPFAPPFLLEAIDLPPGLAVNPATGRIQGRATTVGTYTATLVGTNSAGTGPYRNLVITVQPAPAAPVITSGTVAEAQAGNAFSYQITASNSPTAFEVLGAPAWMTVNSATGEIAGTPPMPRTIHVRLVASNSVGSSNPVRLTINIRPSPNAPVVTSTRTAKGQLGAAFTYQIEANGNPTAYVVSGLPGGLSLNRTTGVISGVPTASGRFEVEMSAVNASGASAPVTLALTISANAVLVVPGS